MSSEHAELIKRLEKILKDRYAPYANPLNLPGYKELRPHEVQVIKESIKALEGYGDG